MMYTETPATHELSWTSLLRQLAAHRALPAASSPNQPADVRSTRLQAMAIGRTIGEYYQTALQLPAPCSRKQLPLALAALQRDLGVQLSIQHADDTGISLLLEACPWEARALHSPDICGIMRDILSASIAWLYGYARASHGLSPSAATGHCHFHIALKPDDVAEEELAGQFTRREMEELARVPAQQTATLSPEEAAYERLYHQQVALTGKLERALGIENAEIEHLRSFNRLKQDFLANVSHEFRTPITNMQGYLTLLQQEAFGALNTDQLDALDTARRNLEHLKRLVDDVLEYSQLTHGNCCLAEEHVEITDILTRAMQLAGEPAHAQRITITPDIHPPLGQMLGDREKLVQIVTHLLENAVKFSAPGSEIVLAGHRRHDHAEITVRDSGIGMSPAQLQTAFVPFVQGETGLSRRFGGLGMGLSRIHRLVMLHGGHITINSAIGEGTTVTVALPLHELPQK